MDAKFADVVTRSKLKADARVRGLTITNLLIRAQRMQEEVVKDVDFHKYNKVTWDPDKTRWGQKRWATMADCADDVTRIETLRARVVAASKECDNVMRFDLTIDELCAALEATAIELEEAART